MRLAVDYRLLASPENIVNRGIGRYTQQQLHHVLRLDAENEYLLLCPPGADVSLVLPEIRAAANVSLCIGPPSGGGRASEYQDWVHGLGTDLYHATCPFWLEQTVPLAWDACPMVATVYDLIPLIFPAAYLADPRHQTAYARAASFVTSATRILAISEGTRHDAATYLGFDREAIDCARPFADACFRPLPDDESHRALRALDARVGLPGSFALTVAALHHSKNLELLLAAYGRLSAAFRRSMPLVVACHLNAGGVAHLRAWAESFGVADDIVVTGYVSDGELVALYNRATLVVHPSRYEGFGLPVVEAMQCGAAVITTSAPTLPEVAGDAAVLVDPDDATGLALAIEALSRDEAARRRLGEAGRARAGMFTPEVLAAETLDCYRKALGGRPQERGRPRVAVCAPMERRTEDLVRALAGQWDVELFTDGPVAEEVVDCCAVHDVTALGRCHEQRPFDAVIGAGEGLPGVDIMHGDGMGMADPLRRSPQLETVLARGRLGWPVDRFIALVLDPHEAGIEVGGAVDLHVADPVSVDQDELLACDLVVVPGIAPAPLIVTAAAAAKPMVLGGAPDVGPEVAGFCEHVAQPHGIGHRVLALAGDPALLARRSGLARAWYEREAAPPVLARLYAGALGAPPEPAVPAGLNRLCQAEDLVNGDVVAWATAQARRAIGPLGREARILWLGERGAEAALDFTTEVAHVTLAGPWLDDPGSPVGVALLADPALVATGPFDPARLTVRHADLCRLPFPSDAFDGVVSCFAEGQAFTELARVVRPGGVVAAAQTGRLPVVVPECGLEPVDEIDLTLSDRTMRTRRRFHAAVRPGVPDPGDAPLVVAEGAVLGYLHLALRKPAGGQSSG